MDEITALKAENERLRDLLIENDIDPEPYVEPPPQFGPPTLTERLMQEMIAQSAAQISLAFLKDIERGESLRIRLPTDFSVTR